MKQMVIDVERPEDVAAAIASVLQDVERSFHEASYEQPLREQVVPLLSDSHEQLFDKAQSPAGDPWKPLAPQTIKRKGHDVILIETNYMRSSLLFSGAPDHVEIITDHGLTWGTSDPKAIVHQEGTRRIPARPFVGMTNETVTQAAEIIADATVAAIG